MSEWPDTTSMNLVTTLLPRLGVRVSTAWRRSSACINNPPWYFETLAFDGDKLIEQLGGSGSVRVALAEHCALVERLVLEREGAYAPFERQDDLYEMHSKEE